MAKEDSITAPFNDEQIAAINAYQKNPFPHALTCCGHNGCERHDKDLLAQTDGLVCPCGQYTQKWVPPFIIEKKAQLNQPLAHRINTRNPCREIVGFFFY
jgi:hypothetical protein